MKSDTKGQNQKKAPQQKQVKTKNILIEEGIRVKNDKPESSLGFFIFPFQVYVMFLIIK
jgi:hypothetical protein